MSPSFIIFRWF